jgi:thymidylate synthase
MAQQLYVPGVDEVRHAFGMALDEEDFVTDKSGVKTIEIVGSSFVADDVTIFDKVNWDYVDREIEWYKTMSLNVNDIPGGPPAIWTQVADPDGFINSNYGRVVWGEDVHGESQYKKVVEELVKNPLSRRAIIIYTRPQMWWIYNLNGRSDFTCTNAHQYLIRDGRLDVVVQMRSNDAVFGYKNDRAWAAYVQKIIADDLGVPTGQIYWNAGSLHVYERHFYIVDHYLKTGDHEITKREYRELYPDSPWKP